MKILFSTRKTSVAAGSENDSFVAFKSQEVENTKTVTGGNDEDDEGGEKKPPVPPPVV